MNVAGVRRSRQIAITALATTLCFTMTGCYDRQELEQQAFVTSLGVDKAPNGMLDCTFEIALPKAAGGSGGGGGGSQPLASKGPITVRGKTVIEALSLANASVERTMTMTHLNSVIFGEDLAKEGLNVAIRPLTRFREFRRTIFIKVAKGKAKDVMTNDKPMLETTNTRIPDDVQNVGSRTGMVPIQSHLQDFTLALETPHQNPVLPVYGVNQSVLDDPEGKQPLKGGVSSTAGQVVRSGGNPVEYIGGAVFQQDKLAGYLTGQEMMELRMLRGTLRQIRMDFEDPQSENQTVTLSIQKGRAPKIQVRYGNPLRIQIRVAFDADLVGVTGTSNYTQTASRVLLEQSVDRQLEAQLEPLIQSWAKKGVDLVPVSNVIRGSFYTDAAFTRYPWEQKLEHAKIQVFPMVHIRRFGTQLAPVAEKT